MVAKGALRCGLLVGVLVSAGACSPPQQAPVRLPTAPPMTNTAADSEPVADAEEEPAPGEHTMLTLTEVLPADTTFVLVTRNLFELADKLGRKTLVERFPKDHEKLAQEMRDEVGADLTTPEGVAELGLDPYGPAGVAAIWPDRNLYGMLFTVASRTRLRRNAQRWERLHLLPDSVGDRLLLLSESSERVSILVHGRTALVLVSESGGTDVRELTREIARLDASAKLTTHRPFVATLEGIPRDRDGLLYLSTSALLGRVSPLMPILPDIQGIGCALDVQPNEVGCELRVMLSEGSVLRRIAESARPSPAGGPPIVQWLDEDPAFLLHAGLDPDRTAAELRSSLGPLWGMLSAELGVDLDREVIPLVDGSVGMAFVVADRGPRPKSLPALEHWRQRYPKLTLFIGLRDAAGMQRLLQRLTTTATRSRLVRSGRDFKAPQSSEGPFLGIRGNTLVVTNDEPHLKAIRDPSLAQGKWRWTTQGETNPFLLGVGPGTLVLAGGLDDYEYWSQPTLAPATPLVTAEERAKQQEIEELERQRRELELAYERNRKRHDERIAASTGSFWLSLGEASAGLAGYATYRVPGATFGEAFTEVAHAQKEKSAESDRYWTESNRLSEQLAQKRAELEVLQSRRQPSGTGTSSGGPLGPVY